MSLKNDRQYRQLTEFSLTLESKRIKSDYYIEGYAATWDPYILYEDFDGKPIYEKFGREAFTRTDMQDIILQFDHEGPVFARKSNGTLIVEPDDKGLFIAADLSKTERGKQLYEEISQGMITKMSWGFRPGEYDYDEDSRTITHRSVKKIYDVSAVSLPANEETEIHARGFADGAIAKLAQELRNDMIEKIGLKIKTVIGNGKKE